VSGARGSFGSEGAGQTANPKGVNKKKGRRETAERRRERRYAAALKKRDPKLAEELASAEWLLPNMVKVFREHYGRAP
jgi:phage shock protein A